MSLAADPSPLPLLVSTLDGAPRQARLPRLVAPHPPDINSNQFNRAPPSRALLLEISVPVPARLGGLIGLGIAVPLAPTRPVGRGGVALVGELLSTRIIPRARLFSRGCCVTDL